MKIAGPDPFNGIPCGLTTFSSVQFMFIGRRTVTLRRLLILIEQARPNFVAGKIGLSALPKPLVNSSGAPNTRMARNAYAE